METQEETKEDEEGRGGGGSMRGGGQRLLCSWGTCMTEAVLLLLIPPRVRTSRAQRWAATRCNARQHTAAHCKHTAAHCSTLQPTATHRNTLQRTATHCNTLHHTATHCIQNGCFNRWAGAFHSYSCFYVYISYSYKRDLITIET